MGLITTEQLPVVNTFIEPQTIPSVGGRVCTDGSSSSGVTDLRSFDRTLYRVFSMQDDMKVLTYPARVRSEFDLFLQYAEAKTAGEVDSNFNMLDEYLGSLGVTEEYCEVN